MDMTVPGSAEVIRQHLIDPEICIRCNTCEATCPVDAITHDDRNYVVKPEVCNLCMACISPCPTGAIDHWRTVLRVEAYPIEQQLLWDELPAERALPEGVSLDVPAEAEADVGADALAGSAASAAIDPILSGASVGATVPPWSPR